MTSSALSTRPTRPSFGAFAQYEHVLARVGIGVILLHVLDQSFVQPNPGASAGDHLVSGLVPAFALLVAAWVYPSLRPGVRASMALFIGCFGVVAGASDGGYRVLTFGASGDDFSGLLAMLGGLLLLGVGIVMLWTSRRLDERPRRRYLRRFLVGVAALVVIIEIVFPILFTYGYTHFVHSFVPDADLGVSYEDVRFKTSDGVTLAGWYVPSKNRAAVIVFPAGGRSEGHEHVRMLARHGYGVLIFDPRGTGESDGDPERWGGERDVKAAIAYLRTRHDVDPSRIGGLGLSLGGETMLQTAAATNTLQAVVSEGAGIRSIREALDRSGPQRWLTAPFWATWTAASAVFSNQAPPPDLEDLVSRISPRPVFLIYSGHPVGGEELNPTFYAAAGEPKTLWKIADAGHTDGLQAHPTEYEKRVIAFFDRALLSHR